jgi:hypothetical protein
MRKRPRSWYSKFTMAAAGLTGFAMLLGAPQLRADDCQKRTERAAHHLREAIDHHGPDSRQADHARHELRDAREYCWSHGHRWWDPDARQWHNDRNWDNDNDHHDHDDNH